MKKYQKVLLIILAVIVALAVLKNVLIKSAITTVGSNVLGAKIKIRSFSLSLIRHKVHIKDMVVYNPKGFPKEQMVNIPEVRVDLDVGSLLKGKLHLPMVIFDLKEMVLVKDKDGNLNVDALKVAQTQEKPAGEKEQDKPEKSGEMMPMHIDELHLNVGRVIVKDYSKGDKPVILAYETAIQDKVLKNIKSPTQLATVVMVQTMAPTAIKGAKIYGAATLLGTAFLPAGAAAVLVGKDSSTEEYRFGFDEVYTTSLDLLKQLGEMKSEDRGKGVLKAKVNGSDVALKIEETPEAKMKVTISARKMMLPKPEVAGGIQYQIEQNL